MKSQEFNDKYGLGFSYQSYLTAGFRTAAQNLTITRTDDRMPTVGEEVKVRVNPAQALYIRYLRSYLSVAAKFRPLMSGGLAEMTKDFESMMVEESPSHRQAYEGIPPEFIKELQKQALAELPENSVELRKNLIENGARSEKVSPAAYAKQLVARQFDRGGDLKKPIETLKALEEIHAKRGWRLGNLFTNIREWWTIRSIRNDLEKAAGGRQAFEKAYAEEPEPFNLRENEMQEIVNACNERIAEREAAGNEPARENLHVAEAEEPVAQTSEKTEEIQPVAPQKELQ